MKVKFLSRASSPHYQAAPGDILDMPASEAKPLIDGGFARPAGKEPVETAEEDTAPAERAVTRRRKTRKG